VFLYGIGNCGLVIVQVIVCTAEYAQVTKMLGNGRLEATCFDGTKRLCHIRGKLRKKVTYLQHSNTPCPEKMEPIMFQA